jgi:hypothetical protein
MRAHDSHKFFSRESHHIEFLDHNCVLMLLVGNDSKSIGSLTLCLDILSSHSEDHSGTSTVLNSSITSKLNEVRHRKESRNVIAIILNILDNFDGLVQLRIVCPLQFSVESKNTT